MSQMSFSDFEYVGKRKQIRRERFLAEMKQVVPWSGLVALIESHYPKVGGGRKPYPLDTMLRVHLLQNWFSLSGPAMEEALYEITSMRQFARLAQRSYSRRHDDHESPVSAGEASVGGEHSGSINNYLRDKGLSLRQSTIVAAIITHAPSSTKNKEGKRDLKSIRRRRVIGISPA